MTRGHRLVIAALTLGLATAVAIEARQAQPGASVQEHVALLKATLAASQAALRQYEWIETTIVTLKGEEKSRQEHRCYYGAEGSVQKVPLSQTAAKRPRGLKGKIADNKKEELTDYMQQAVALVKQYVPPDPARIQMVKDAGGLSLTPLPGPGKRMKLTFANYMTQGDSLAVDIDLASHQLLRSTVSSRLSAEDPVALTVTFATLNDGSSYTKDIVLDAPSQKVLVNVQHSGYRKLTQ